MAASSSTAASIFTVDKPNIRNPAYDVFINCGVDVKETFARSLYLCLLNNGLTVFLDKEEAQPGEEISRLKEAAIRIASVHVAIFSPRYPESQWCLNELLLMLESNVTILPIFYHVEPSELRWTRGKGGNYAQTLQRLAEEGTHEGKLRYHLDTIENWRKALSIVADFSGFVLEAYDGDEGKLLNSVVQYLLKTVEKRKSPAAKYPIGLDEKLKQFEDTVLSQGQQSKKTQILGIVGLGGIGKTTLAKEFFNRKKSDYHRSCFLSDVRDKAAKGSLSSLQTKLIKSLTLLNKPAGSVDEGQRMLIKPLKSSKVLIVLDDADHPDQVDALLPVATDDLYTGSLILITARDKRVLRSSGVENSSIYCLTGLNRQQSEELFCYHAFSQPYPNQGFESLVHKFLESCNGLPLSLKVLGALLNGREDICHWKKLLESIQVILPIEIQNTLMISYDALNEKEKQIFLDIACFFVGENRDIALRISNASGWEGWLGFQNLQSKCLVEVDNWNVVLMHNHLRILGRVIARASSPCRLLRWTENDIDDLVQQSSVYVIPVRGIRMVGSEYHDNDPFDNIRMKGLQLVDTEGLRLERILRSVKFSDIIWLRWRECPYTSLPSWIPMSNLRVLHVSGNTLETLWQEESEAPLRLEELWADGCMQLKSLRGLARCTKLRKLIVSKCWELEELPSMERLVSMEELRVNECVMLKTIRGLEQCTEIRHINVSGCHELEKLPSIETLLCLEEFYASNCVKLKSIRGLSKCTKLRHLNVSGCFDLEKLPSMKTLVSLEELRVDEFVKLKNIRGLLQCTKLRHLDVSGCSELQALSSLEALGSLEELWANRCVKLKSIRGLEHATKLRQLNVSECSELEELPSMETLICLEELWADDCVKLKSIRGLEQARKLRLLNVSGCSELEELPFMETVVSLKVLRAIGCVKLKSIRGLEHCTELSMLSVSRCCELEELPNMETLVSVEELWANGCVKLKSIRGLEHATKLQQLNISECSELKELPSMETLVSLEIIGVTGCVKLKGLQGLAQCTKLKKVSFRGCSELEELPSIETLISLGALRVNECVKLRCITGLEQCTKLRYLDVSGCSELEELPSMETLVSLEEFYASDCVKLKSIPGLAQCTDLRMVSVGGCSELEELPSMETLVSLVELRVNNCGKLKSIRGLAQCKKLRCLDVSGCFELVELEGVWSSVQCLDA